MQITYPQLIVFGAISALVTAICFIILCLLLSQLDYWWKSKTWQGQEKFRRTLKVIFFPVWGPLLLTLYVLNVVFFVVMSLFGWFYWAWEGKYKHSLDGTCFSRFIDGF